MTKNILSYLITLVLTVLITAALAIPMTTSIAVLVAMIFVRLLVNALFTHISEKRMPKIIEWVEYAFELVALVLFACGFAYTSTYCLIFAVIAAIITLICAIMDNKKTPMIMDPETEPTTEPVVEEPKVEDAPATEEAKTEE